MDVVLALVGHESEHAREAAVLALGEMAEPDDSDALEALAECLEDASGTRVPGLAAEMLERLMPVASPSLWETVAARLAHPRAQVRAAASGLLVHVAGEQPGGLPLVVAAAVRFLGHGDNEVRSVAAQTLTGIAQHGHADVAKMVVELLYQQDVRIRAAAISVLASVGGVVGLSDPDVVGFVVVPLSSPVWYVRQAALEALGKVCSPGDSSALGHLLAYLADDSPDVRAAASASIVWLCPTGDEAATASLADKLARPLPGASGAERLARLRALKEVASPGAKAVRLAVVSCVEDANLEVRAAALEVLGTSRRRLTFREGDDCSEEGAVIAAVAALLRHRQGPVRSSAVQALVAEGLPADVAVSRLPSSAAAWAEPLRRRAVAAAALRVADSSWDVRRAAVDALARLVPPQLKAGLFDLGVLLDAQDEASWASALGAAKQVLAMYCDDGGDLPSAPPAAAAPLGPTAGAAVAAARDAPSGGDAGAKVVCGTHGRRFLQRYHDRATLGLY